MLQDKLQSDSDHFQIKGKEISYKNNKKEKKFHLIILMKNLLDKDKSLIRVLRVPLNNRIILVWLTFKSQGTKPGFLLEDFFLTI